MNINIAQAIEVRSDGKTYLQNDWYPKAIPENVVAEDMVYLDSTYSFACFHSEQKVGFYIGYASGNYLHSHFLVGKHGSIRVGKYVILEATSILANENVTIGNNCMFSWGSVITDSWLVKGTYSISARRKILKDLSTTENRFLNIPHAKPVVIEDNVWVGFDAVIMPGVRLGRGCVVGCKTVITEDVPPYAVIVGEPARIVKFLEPDDAEEQRSKTIADFSDY